MEFLVNVAPSSAEVAQRKLLVGDGDAATEKAVVPDPAASLVGLVFKVYSDPKSHIKYSVIRLLAGTIKADTAFHIGQEKKPIRAGHIYRLKGAELIDVPQAEPGQILALARIDELKVGDVIHMGSESCKLPIGPFPVPMFAQAVEPKSRGDETKISGALHRLAEEDPCFRTDRDRQTGELVVYGTSDLHLRLVLEKMVRRFKVEVNVHPPKIPYRETISMPAEGHYRHKKQTGGAGQFGEVYLKVEPMDRNTGFEFVDDIFGGAIPGQFLPAIEKGVHDLMEQGAVAGFPLQDIRVRVYDGKHHPVDSKEVAFRIAGKLAMKEAIQKAKPVLLEPVVHIEVTVPAQFVGDITGDLSGRRGRISGQDVLPGGMAVIKAQVPLSEVMQYNSQLRSVTGGQGSYSMELSHYDPVPPNVQQEIVKQYQPKKDVDEE
jgi:elongation factor G